MKKNWLPRITGLLGLLGLNTLATSWYPNVRAVLVILFLASFYLNNLIVALPMMYSGELTVAQSVEVLTFVQTHGVTMYRIYFLIRFRKQLIKLVDLMERVFPSWSYRIDIREDLQNSLMKGHWVYIVQSVQYLTVGPMLMIRPLLSKEPHALVMEQPLGRVPFLPFDQSPYYEITYVLQTMYMLIAMAVAFCANMLFFTLTMRTCAHLGYLSTDIELLDDDLDICSSTVKEFVDRHNTVKEFVDLENVVYSTVTALQPLYASFSIITSSLVFDGTQQTISFVGIAIAHTFELFVFCYAGDMAAEMSQGLGDRIFASRWYKFHQRDKKSILRIVQQCQRPFGITSGFLGVLSFGMFASTMNTTYSIWAVANQAK